MGLSVSPALLLRFCDLGVAEHNDIVGVFEILGKGVEMEDNGRKR